MIRRFIDAALDVVLPRVWELRRRLGLHARVAGPEKLCVIIPVFHRARNLETMLKALVLCDFVSEIVITNNNPAIDVSRHVRTRDPRITLINQPERRTCCNRYELARDRDARYFLSVDDDVFLGPGQIRGLFSALLKDPDVAHGVAGEIYEEETSRLIFVPPQDREVDSLAVDILIEVYAFTADHVARYFELLAQAGAEKGPLTFCDIGISAAAGRPRIHGLGRLWLCPTATEPGIALWTSPGFTEARLERFHQLRAITPLKTP